MNNNLDVVYNKFKHIISGCNTYEDALLFCNSTNLNQREHDIVMSIINSQKFDNITIDTISFVKLLTNVGTFKYKEDVYNVIDNIKKKLTSTHLKTLMRIADMKLCKPQDVSLKVSHEKSIIDDEQMKKCPHCGHYNVFPKNSKYVICGYPENGYDWIGCGKDWCFECEKMLCKSWDVHKLQEVTNRCHDGSCCMSHASRHNHDYRLKYCQCSNENVKRV